MGKLAGVIGGVLFVGFIFLSWFNDPSTVATREAKAYYEQTRYERQAEWELRQIELDTERQRAITWVSMVAVNTLIVGCTAAGLVIAGSLALAAYRRSSRTALDARGLAPLTDKQLELVATKLAEQYQTVLLAEVMNRPAQITDNRTQVVALPGAAEALEKLLTANIEERSPANARARING